MGYIIGLEASSFLIFQLKTLPSLESISAHNSCDYYFSLFGFDHSLSSGFPFTVCVYTMLFHHVLD